MSGVNRVTTLLNPDQGREMRHAERRLDALDLILGGPWTGRQQLLEPTFPALFLVSKLVPE